MDAAVMDKIPHEHPGDKVSRQVTHIKTVKQQLQKNMANASSR
jgi:hypothetical protein